MLLIYIIVPLILTLLLGVTAGLFYCQRQGLKVSKVTDEKSVF